MLTNFFGNRGFFNDWAYDNSAPYFQIRESEKAAMIELEVPRYRAEDLSVDCDADHGIITVTGRRGAAHDTEEFSNLVYASSPLGSFRRSFSFAPKLYDVAKFSTKLDAGVFQVIVPKQTPPPAPQPVTVFGGNKEGQLVTTTTPEEFKAIRNTKWPPVIRHEETAEALTYKCEMPPSVTKDHIKLSLVGRALTLSIGYDYSVKSKNREESQSLSYATTLAVPQGTNASDITTAMDNGVLTITLAKHQSVPVIEGKK
jgi:HSP20 family molecular chaperone IbpA